MDVQMKRGLLDVCVLAAIQSEDSYGYQIIKDIKPYVDDIVQQVMFAEKSWGSYKVIDIEPDGVTIKVTLNAGHSMNYHSHKNRDEVWVVVSGQGKTIIDGMEQWIQAGDVLTMSAGCKHTVIADTELKLIEVQLGREITAQDKEIFELE